MAAESRRSEHSNVDTKIPLVQQHEYRACPNVPCERRTDSAEPNPTPRTDPKNLQKPKPPQGEAQRLPIAQSGSGIGPQRA